MSSRILRKGSSDARNWLSQCDLHHRQKLSLVRAAKSLCFWLAAVKLVSTQLLMLAMVWPRVVKVDCMLRISAWTSGTSELVAQEENAGIDMLPTSAAEMERSDCLDQAIVMSPGLEALQGMFCCSWEQVFGSIHVGYWYEGIPHKIIVLCILLPSSIGHQSVSLPYSTERVFKYRFCVLSLAFH